MTDSSEEKKKEYTLEEIAQHTSDKSCWMIIGNESNGGPKVYDVTAYLDEHPGGSEVLLDVGGKDADEFFEDIGHSSDARATMAKYYVGEYKMDEAAKLAMKERAEAKKSEGGISMPMIIACLIVLAGIVFTFLGGEKE